MFPAPPPPPSPTHTQHFGWAFKLHRNENNENQSQSIMLLAAHYSKGYCSQCPNKPFILYHWFRWRLVVQGSSGCETGNVEEAFPAASAEEAAPANSEESYSKLHHSNANNIP
jgi:hypothetical protein